MAYADYSFYTDVYGGTAIVESAFPRLSEAASAYIDAMTYGRSQKADGAALNAVKMAMCAISDIINDEDRLFSVTYGEAQEVASESVGGWSRSYVSKKASAVEIELIDKRKREAIFVWLGHLNYLMPRSYYVDARGRTKV